MKKAFTLVEIMIVIAIIAILAGIAVPNFISYRQTVQARMCKATIHRISRACESYSVRMNAAPTGIGDLVTVNPPFLKTYPKCPIGGTYTISHDATKGYVVTCGGHDPATHDVNE